MDPSRFARLQQKIRVEQIRDTLQQQVPSCPPPPYEDDDSDMESDEEDDEDAPEDNSSFPPSLPMKLTINAANRIEGNNNLVPTSACPLAAASNFSGLLMQAVSQLNSIAAEHVVAAGGRRRAARPLQVDLTINCGMTVIGDRNVVGNVGLRPKAGTPVASMVDATDAVEDGSSVQAPAVISAVSAGAKRKADETSSADDEPVAKRIAGEIED